MLTSHRLRRISYYTLLVALLLLGIYLRLWNVTTNPAWYTDEVTHLEIARQLLAGEIRYFAIQDSWLIFARMPLFEYVLAGVFAIAEVSITALRQLTGGLGVLTGVMLYGVLRACGQRRIFSVASAGIWWVLPQAILYNRFGFSYNLLLPLVVLILLGGYRYRVTADRRWLALVAVSIGVGTLSDIIMWSFVPVVLLMTFGIRWRDMLWALPLSLLPLGGYLLAQGTQMPEVMTFDLAYTLGRTTGTGIGAQMRLVLENYLTLLRDPWWLVASMGILLLHDHTLRTVTGMLCVPLLLVARTVPLYSLSAYYVLPFLPLVALGVGSFLMHGWQVIRQRTSPVLTALVTVGVLLPIGVLSWDTVQAVDSGFSTPIDAFLVDAASAQAAADYINANATDNDLVISSAPVGWLIDRRIPVAEFQMAAIANGADAVHLPGDLPAERFAFATDYRQARYVVVDNLWRNWGAVHIPQIARMLSTVADWEPVYAAGTITVYENPQQS